MKTFFGVLAIAVVLLSIVVAAVAYEVMLWNECRGTNSWFYCMRVLGGK